MTDSYQPIDLFSYSCPQCEQTTGLAPCEGCFEVYYCSLQHKVNDRKSHEKDCVAVRDQRLVYQQSQDRFLDREQTTMHVRDIMSIIDRTFWHHINFDTLDKKRELSSGLRKLRAGQA